MNDVKDNQSDTKSSIKKKIIFSGILAGIILGFCVLSMFTYYLIMNSSPSGLNSDTVFQVKKGAHVRHLAAELKKQRLIKSRFLFHVLSRLNGLHKKLKPGYYRITRGMSSGSIIRLLYSGDFIKIRVVIPEGYTNLQIANRLENSQVCNREEFLKKCADAAFLKKLGIPANNAEGYLFPATYEFPYKSSAELVIRQMVNNFKSAVDTLRPNSGLSITDTIILASVIEGETFIEEEKPVISGVYMNRLKKGMPLQADITIKYIKMPRILEYRAKVKELRSALKQENHPEKRKMLENEIKIWQRRATIITYADLRIDNPYNTYVHKGLPPGPVCNPGLSSLKAAFQPQNTHYIFYFWNPDKRVHIFSATFQEHSRKLSAMRRQARAAGSD